MTDETNLLSTEAGEQTGAQIDTGADSISKPVTAPETPIHPVLEAAHAHVSKSIFQAFMTIPEDISHDFSATITWIKDHI